MDQAAGDLPGLSLSLFLLQSIDQLDGGEEADALFVMLDGLHAKRGGDVGFTRARRSRDILPGITTLKGEFSILFIRDAVNR